MNPQYPHRLYRCTHDRTVAGVAAGMAEYFNADPTVVRILWILGILFTGGMLLILYVAMAVIVPQEPYGMPAGPWQPGSAGWQPGSDRWGAPGWAPQGPAGWPAGQNPSGWPAGQTPSGWPAGQAPQAATAGETGENGDPATGTGEGTEGTGTPAGGPGTTSYTMPPSYWQPAPVQERRPSNLVPLFGIVLIMFGVIALANEFLPSWSDRGALWPLFIVGLGVLFVVNSIRSRSENR